MPNTLLDPQTSMIVPLFQPVVCLRSGHVVGVEALARLQSGPTLLTPDRFLPELDDDGLLSLFHTMLAKSVDVYVRNHLCRRDIYLSLNVNAQLVLRPEFHDLVHFILAEKDFDQRHLVLEILESDAIGDMDAMKQVLERLRATGIRFALDDIGSAYASLMNIKDLPIDILKLDQAFARKLEERPHDLQFVMSILGLARGLGKTLIVEGAETLVIVEALKILGVDFVQGYALSHPLPEAALASFLRTWQPVVATKTPQSLLGSYASHLTVVETCHMLATQPLKIEWQGEAKNPHSCHIGVFFDKAGVHETSYGRAHKKFHAVLDRYETEPEVWEKAAEDFRIALVAAMETARHEATMAKPETIALRKAVR